MRVHRGTHLRYRGREIITVIRSAKTPDFCDFSAGIEISGPKCPYKMVGKVFEVRVGKKVFRAAKELAAFTYPRSAKRRLFTHPIFESDFDCLTGKNRLHALSLLSPLASYKLEKFTKKNLHYI